jgi:hypothetical protein
MGAKPLAGRVILLILCVAPLIGCGPTSPRRPVSGNVTFRGKPLKRGTIQFLDDKGPAGGALIRDGGFQLSAEQGLVPGTYRVWVSATEPLPGPPPGGMSSPPTRELIPAEFNSKTTQTVAVTDQGPNVFSFDIPGGTPQQ